MKILEYGEKSNKVLLLLHGFVSPYQVLFDYVEYYKNDYFIIMPIIPGHYIRDNEEFISSESFINELNDYLKSNNITNIEKAIAFGLSGILLNSFFNNSSITMNKLILEDTPLVPFKKKDIDLLTKYYIDSLDAFKIKQRAIIMNSLDRVVKSNNLQDFLNMINHFSNNTIINFLKELETININLAGNIVVIINEKHNVLLKSTIKYLKKNKMLDKVVLRKKDYPLYEALIYPELHIKLLDLYKE